MFRPSQALSRLLSLLVLAIAVTAPAAALPQFTLLNGNRCNTCHVAPAGGGQRTVLGWYATQDVGLVPRSALPWLYPDDESNTYANGALSFGVDLRAQSTRSVFSDDAKRQFFPMQAAVYGMWRPDSLITIEGSFNLASLRPNGSGGTVRYPGQRAGHLSAIVAPAAGLPTLRVGFFRPSIGMRYDDHTMFPYSWVTATSRQTYYAPNWAEVGAEITYEGPLWLTLQAGVFGSEGLSQVMVNDGVNQARLISGNAPTITARAVVWPSFLQGRIPAYVGTSMLLNGDFTMVSAMAGVGLMDDLSLMADYTHAERKGALTTDNVMLELMWRLAEPVLPYVRWESGTTRQVARPGDQVVHASIVGAQVFVMPYVELRPEYRIWDTDLPGSTTRWNVQLHIFY